MQVNKSKNGITLITLIITVILLLMLATVSCKIITDHNIFRNTRIAKKQYSANEEAEMVKQAVNNAVVDGEGKVMEKYLTPTLDEQFGKDNWEYTFKKDGEYLVIRIKESQRKYVIDIDGDVEIIQDVILAETDMFEYSDNSTVAGLSTAGYEKIAQKVKRGSEVKIKIPKTYTDGKTLITNIKEFAFYARYEDLINKITDVEIPEGVKTIEKGAFWECTGLTNIIIPSSVEEIEDGAFEDCTNLKSIIIPDKVKNIQQMSFAGCTSLTNVTIPSGIKKIGWFAFNECTSLKDITIPNSVEEIGGSAFGKCTSLTNVTIPESVTEMGTDIFGGCTNLTKAIIKSKKIGSGTFSGCQKLTDVTIEKGVTSIGDGAFNRCGLKKIEIPQTVITVGSLVFRACSNLIEIYCPGNTSQPDGWDSMWGTDRKINGVFLNSSDENIEVYWNTEMPK